MNFSRRDFLKLAGVTAGAGILPNIKKCGVLGTGVSLAGQDSPNVIMIVVDTLRADHLSSMGYCRKTTPNLDEHAGHAVKFENAISPAPWTFPSLASLMTGMLACNHNQNLAPANSPALDHLMLPELLKQAGYNTCSIYVNWLVEKFSFGFDESYAYCGGRNNDDEQAAQAAIDWLSDAHTKAKEKFFMLIWLMGPHRPYEPDNGFLEDFVRDEMYESSPLRNVEIQGHLISPKDLTSDAYDVLGHPLSHDQFYHDYRLYVAAYDSEIKHADHQIGRVFRKLQQDGLYDDAMILVTSDHGENLVDHEVCFSHGGNLYNSLIHVPLFIKFPRQQGPILVKNQVRTIDAMPTVLNVLNIDPGIIDGRSLVPYISRQPVFRHERPCISYLRTSGHADMVSIVAGRYKLIKSSQTGDELYDYFDDHDETTNLISSHPEVHEILSDELSHFYEPR